MKVKVGYAKSLRVGSGGVGYGLVFGQSTYHIFRKSRIEGVCGLGKGYRGTEKVVISEGKDKKGAKRM